MSVWNRLDRYVSSELRAPFFLGLSGFSFLLLLQFLFEFAKQTIEKNVPVELVLGFLLARVPTILLFSVPMACLLAVLVAMGRLSSQGELLALRATGVSLPRIYRPVLVVSLLLMAVLLAVSHFGKPLGIRHEKELVTEIMRARDLNQEIDAGVFFSRLPGAVFYAEKAANSSDGRVFEGILLYRESRRDHLADLIVARRGQGEFDGETGRVVLRLDDVEWHAYNPEDPSTYTVVESPFETLTFPPTASFQAYTKEQPTTAFQPRHLVAADLSEKIDSLRAELAQVRTVAAEERAAGKDNARQGEILALKAQVRQASIEWMDRWSLPMAIPVLMFTAFPMASRVRRGGRFTGMVQALGVIFVFWFFLSLAQGFTETGRVPPQLGVWLPHAATLLWGAVLWVLLIRDREHRRSVIAGLTAAFRRFLGRRRSQDVPRLAQVDRWGGLTRLDSYLASGLIKMLLVTTIVIFTLIAAVDFGEALQAVPSDAKAFPWKDVVFYVLLSLPGRLRDLLPVIALFAVMISLSGLARNGEIVAFKAAGIGPMRIALPLIVVTFGVCALYGAAQETVLPAADRGAREAQGRLKGRPITEDRSTGRRWIVGERGHFWTYMGWEQSDEKLLMPELLVIDLEAGRVRERISATASSFIDPGWRFENGWRRRFFPGSPPLYEEPQDFDEGFREDPEVFGVTGARRFFKHHLADQKSTGELLQHVRRLSAAGYNAAPLMVGLHEKFVNPLLPSLLVLLGIPLMASGHSRKTGFHGFGIGLSLAFLFYALRAVSLSLGRQEVLSPALSVWLVPALLLIASGYLLARAK